MWVRITALTYRRAQKFKPSFESVKLPSRWEEIFSELYPGAIGAALYQGSQDGIATVKVQDPLWIGELSAQKERLCAALSEGSSKPIRDIKFIL